MFTTLKRVIRNGCIGFYRNKTISISAIVIMTITLLIIGGLFYSRAMLKHALYHVQNKVDVTVFFVINTDEKNILAFKEKLERTPEVKSVEYVSREMALEQFKERNKGDTVALRALDAISGNPFRPALYVRAKNSEQYDSIARFIKNNNTDSNQNPFIDKVDYEDNKEIIDQLNSLIATVNRVGIIIASLFMFTSILIIYNTIRLAIYVFRDEIGVMRLVGADRFYVRGPFVVEGMLYGLIAGIIATLLYLPLSLYVREYVQAALVQFDTFEFYLLRGWMLGALLLGTGVLLGMVSSYLSVRKYLNK